MQQFQVHGSSDTAAHAVCMVLCEALADTAGGDHRERRREASSTSRLEGGVVGHSEGPGISACMWLRGLCSHVLREGWMSIMPQRGFRRESEATYRERERELSLIHI